MGTRQAAATTVAADNSYAALFLDYINRSLAESLATVRAVTTKLPDEERVQACHVLDFGLRMADTWPHARALTVAVAPYVERSGQWENWHQQLQRALDLAEQIQDVDGKLGLMVFVARLAQRQGRVAETIYYYRRVIRLARQTGNRFEEARACSNLGYLFTETGRLLRADVLCQHALAIFADLQSRHGLAHTHNHLGLLYTRQRRYTSAEAHLKVACDLWQDLQDHHSLLYGNLNLGLLWIETDRLDDALQSFDLALRIAENSGETVEIAKVWNNLGRVYLNLRDFSLAESYFVKAQRLFSQLSNPTELAKAYYNLGLTYQHLEKGQEAIHHLEQALYLFQALQDSVMKMKALIALLAHDTSILDPGRHKEYITALQRLVAQQQSDEFQHLLQDAVAQYGSSFPDKNPEKLLPWAAA